MFRLFLVDLLQSKLSVVSSTPTYPKYRKNEGIKIRTEVVSGNGEVMGRIG